MIYIYTDEEIVKKLIQDIPNTMLIERTDSRWLEDFEIFENDKVLFIAKNPLGPIKYEKNMIGSFKSYISVGNKIKTRKRLIDLGYSVPKTWYEISQAEYPFIARPKRHSLRKEFYVIRDDAAKKDFLTNVFHTKSEWYYSKLIDVDKEFRILFLNGEDFLVYNKTLGNTVEETIKIRNEGSIIEDEQEIELSNKILSTCLKAMKEINIGYGAIDLVLDKEGKEYILEINSKPNLRRKAVSDAFRNAVIKLAENN